MNIFYPLYIYIHIYTSTSFTQTYSCIYVNVYACVDIDMNVRDKEGRTILMNCIIDGYIYEHDESLHSVDTQTTLYHLLHTPSNLDIHARCNEFGYSCLHYCFFDIRNNHTSVAKTLVEKGADINAREYTGNAIIFASSMCSL
jgi:ankyrin repeat protein